MARTIQKFNEERTFGVEIEFQGNREEVARLMNAKGIRAYVERYNHSTKSHWKLITDASCGSELVSPPLKGREGLEQLKKACEALKEAGASVDRRCGLHVHHDINDYNAKQIANIFAIYIKLEKTIDTFVPNSRRANNNRFCRSLFQCTTQQAILDKLKAVNSLEDIKRIWHTRYVKVNFQSYVKYGTIEFRQHSGTIEFEKIYNWILLTQRIIERAKERNVTYSYKESSVPVLTFQKMLGIINSVGADEEIAKMNTFYLKRMKKLAA
jgi:hypothetical protein